MVSTTREIRKEESIRSSWHGYSESYSEVHGFMFLPF